MLTIIDKWLVMTIILCCMEYKTYNIAIGLTIVEQMQKSDYELPDNCYQWNIINHNKINNKIIYIILFQPYKIRTVLQPRYNWLCHGLRNLSSISKITDYTAQSIENSTVVHWVRYIVWNMIKDTYIYICLWIENLFFFLYVLSRNMGMSVVNCLNLNTIISSRQG